MNKLFPNLFEFFKIKPKYHTLLVQKYNARGKIYHVLYIIVVME